MLSWRRTPSRRSTLSTLRAESVNRQTVLKDDEPFIHQRCDIHLPVSLEPDVFDAATSVTNKMIMVFKCRIIASTAVTKVNRTDLPFFRQPLQIAIDCSETHTR